MEFLRYVQKSDPRRLKQLLEHSLFTCESGTVSAHKISAEAVRIRVGLPKIKSVIKSGNRKIYDTPAGLLTSSDFSRIYGVTVQKYYEDAVACLSQAFGP